ncbi:hypothetical protein JG687_00016588 [Phytophthora cactorum]|uniref:Uncharacterized protein n=1 Tax=Phytophthora cactorum TaxID=29920 RepID=A0A8T1TVK6_9STRA|nr:hypothetical protein JG687_00016588 [Phytophthora cactorum]
MGDDGGDTPTSIQADGGSLRACTHRRGGKLLANRSCSLFPRSVALESGVLRRA